MSLINELGKYITKRMYKPVIQLIPSLVGFVASITDEELDGGIEDNAISVKGGYKMYPSEDTSHKVPYKNREKKSLYKKFDKS